MPIDREEFRESMRQLHDDIQRVQTGVDIINKRVQDTDRKVAVLEERVNQAARATSSQTFWLRHLASSGAGAAIVFVVKWLLSGGAAH